MRSNRIISYLMMLFIIISTFFIAWRISIEPFDMAGGGMLTWIFTETIIFYIALKVGEFL